MDNRHLAKCRGVGSTQRQAWELISGPILAAKTRHLSFDRIQSRVVIGLLTVHNTLRRYLYLLGLTNSPLCRRCAEKDKNLSPYSPWVWSSSGFTQTCISGFLFLDPEDIKSLCLGGIWNFSKGTGLPWTGMRLWGTKGMLIMAEVHQDCNSPNPNAKLAIKSHDYDNHTCYCRIWDSTVCIKSK
jgi:hypothetical protein